MISLLLSLSRGVFWPDYSFSWWMLDVHLQNNVCPASVLGDLDMSVRSVWWIALLSLRWWVCLLLRSCPSLLHGVCISAVRCAHGEGCSVFLEHGPVYITHCFSLSQHALFWSLLCLILISYSNSMLVSVCMGQLFTLYLYLFLYLKEVSWMLFFF